MASQVEQNTKKKTDNPPKKPKKDPAVLGDEEGEEDDDEEDLEELMEGGKRKQKRVMALMYTKVAATGEYITKGEDRKSRLLARQARVENVPEETEEEVAQRQLESDLT